MFEKDFTPVRMRSKSDQAHDFWKNRYKPTMDAIRQKIADTPLSVGIWVHRLIGAARLQVHEVINDLENLNVEVKQWMGNAAGDGGGDTPEDPMASLEALCRGREKEEGEEPHTAGKAPEIVFGIILDGAFDLTRILNISSEASSKLFLFYNETVEERFRARDPNFRFQSVFRRSMPIRYPEDFRDRSFNARFLEAVDALRRVKYIQSLIPTPNKPLKSKRNVFSFYEEYKFHIDTFQSSGQNYFIALVRYLADPTHEKLHQHLDLEAEQIEGLFRYFEDGGFITRDDSGKAHLTYRGDKYFSLIGIDELPILENEKRRFVERWRAALEKTYYTHFELMRNSGQLAGLSEKLYTALAQRMTVTRKLRYFVNRVFFDWLIKEEKAFWDHPWTKELFEIWRRNIAGLKKTWRTEQRDRTAFLEYMFKKFEIAYNPKNATQSTNYKNLAFNLTMLRPNSHAHFYVIFSFIVRPIKKMIRQYFDLAAITGQYDLIFRRFPPYHLMLKFHARPGERTSFDMRNYVDWKPLTHKMDLKYTVPVGLDSVRTRQRDRHISIPVVQDPEAEKNKRAEVEALERKLQGIPRDLPINNDFGADGRIYYTGGGKREVVDGFMGKRGALVQVTDEINLVKAIPRPGADSGLIVRFNLLDPIAVLINGINRRRDLYLDEMRYLAKCLDRLAGAKIEELDGIIEGVFESTDHSNLKEETRDLLSVLERIEKTEGSEEDTWAFLTSRFIHGAFHPLLVTICHRLMSEGFEVLFSLFPLVTGKELRFDEEGKLEERETEAVSKNEIPLVEFLKRELSDLLKNIFTRHIEISGATKRRQSEARLAQMVVAHCLNVKSDPDAYNDRLKTHLKKHYEVHLAFLEEHIGKAELFKYIHKVGAEESDVTEMINNDVTEIIKLTDACRARLFSRANNNRLLCFIDPHSVDVQYGEFEYRGEAIQSELAYIEAKETKQRELAEKQHAQDAEIREREMEKTTAIAKGKHEKEQHEARLAKEKAMREAEFEHDAARVEAEKVKEERITAMLEEINSLKLLQVASETRYLAADALKNQDMRTYAVLSLLDAHQKAGGIEGVEDLLEDSPNLLFAIAPEAVETRHVHKLKEEVVAKLDTILQKVDPITLSTLFSKDYGELIRSDIYKSIMSELSDTLKNFGFRHRPMMEQVFSGTGFHQERDQGGSQEN